MHVRDIRVGQEVVCEGDTGVVEWVHVDTQDVRVRFSDDSAYVHPDDLEPAHITEESLQD